MKAKTTTKLKAKPKTKPKPNAEPKVKSVDQDDDAMDAFEASCWLKGGVTPREVERIVAGDLTRRERNQALVQLKVRTGIDEHDVKRFAKRYGIVLRKSREESREAA